MNGWRPIETAPKDGTEFIACWPQQGGIKQLISWNRVHGYWQSKGKPELCMQAQLWHAMPPMQAQEENDKCGLCGGDGADKQPHPIHWPGERVPDTDLVHAECEQEECGRAHAALTDRQRESFLRSV